MAEPLPDPTTAQRPGTPRWVKAIGIVILAVILIAVVVMVVGGGRHGPGMHTGTGSVSTSADHGAVLHGHLTVG